MQSVPKIHFLTKSSQEIAGFEWVGFGDLFSRASASLDHSPFTFHRPQFNIILLLQEGEVYHKVDLETHHVKAGDCLLIFSNQIHAFDPKRAYQGGLILATDAFLQQHLSPILMRSLRHHDRFSPDQSPIHAPHLGQALLDKLRNDDWQVPFLRKEYIGAALTLFYTQILELESHTTFIPENSSEYALFTKYDHLVSAHFSTSRDAKWYASQLGITYKHLNIVCKKMTQLTAKGFIDQFIMLEAKRKLLSTSSSVKEIGYQMGFDEPTNFQKYFKRHTRYTPKAFRSLYQEVRYLP
ncbi:MAG: helix-turn-helix transcriptional regulator [Bacteroidota bacterium]